MPNLTALENVQIAATLNKNSLDPAECLEMVGLKDRMDHFPTASLDPKTGMMVLDVLAKIVKDRHITVIMTTHDVEFSKLADRQEAESSKQVFWGTI